MGELTGLIYELQSQVKTSPSVVAEEDHVPPSASPGRVDSAAFQQSAKRPFRRHEADTMATPSI